jgi:hypothetical protein
MSQACLPAALDALFDTYVMYDSIIYEGRKNRELNV